MKYIPADRKANRSFCPVEKCSICKIQTKSDKYINFQIWNLYNSKSIHDIIMKWTPFSCIFQELSNDTKYIALWPTRRWLFIQNLNLLPQKIIGQNVWSWEVIIGHLSILSAICRLPTPKNNTGFHVDSFETFGVMLQWPPRLTPSDL